MLTAATAAAYAAGNTPALSPPDQQMQHLPAQPRARDLQPHASDPLLLFFLRLKRIPAALRTALIYDDRLRDFFVDLRDREGPGDAKLVCRPEHRIAVETYLIARGVQLKGRDERLYLNQTRSFHLIVSAEFIATVRAIIRAVPRNEDAVAREIARARISTNIDPTRTPSGPLSESSHVGDDAFDQLDPYLSGGAQPMALLQTPYQTTPALQSTQSAAASSSGSPLAPMGSAAASSTHEAEDVPPTEIDSSEEDPEQQAATIQQPREDGSTATQDESLVISMDPFLVDAPTVSEGQKTASTGQRLGINPRYVRRRLNDSQSSAPDTQASAVPSQSLPSSIADTESLAAGQDSLSLSLDRCDLESQS